MVGIKSNYTANELNRQIKKVINAAQQKYLEGLIKIGQDFVADAKATGRYCNQTGNLRSSIGFIAAVGNQPVASEFNVVLAGETGKKKGIELANTLVLKNPNQNTALIVVAAMDYAKVLESKGRNVLTASSLTAIKDLMSLSKSIMEG